MIVALAVSGALGAVARHLVDAAIRRRVRAAFPLGILVVNLTGSFALGGLVGLGLYHGVGESVRTVAGTGFVGAYTTFSTFSYDTVRLVEEGAGRDAVLNVGVSLVGGLAAAVAGLALAGAL